MKKGVGYLLMLIGLAFVFVRFFGEKLKIGFPPSLTPTITLAIGIALIVIGFLMLLGKKKGEQAVEEVPIYKGEKIVGYRRH